MALGKRSPLPFAHARGRRSCVPPARRRLVAAIALGYCLLAPAAISTAAPGHHLTPSGPLPGRPAAGAPWSARPAESPTGPAESHGPPPPGPPPAPVGPEPHRAAGHEPHRAWGHEQRGTAGGRGSQNAPSPQTQQDAGSPDSQGAGIPAAQRGAGGDQRQDTGVQAQRGHARQGSEAQAQGRVRGRERRATDGSGPSQSAPASATSGSSAGSAPVAADSAPAPAAAGPTASGAAPASAAPSVAAPVAVATPPVATPTAPRKPSRARRPSHVASAPAHHARRRAGRTRGRAARGSVRTGLAGSPAPLLARDARTRARMTRTAPAWGTRRATPRRRLTPPLVTTITTIADVIPAPIRILIGLLVALALALAARSRIAALHARRLERQRAQLLEDVGLLQAALLPVAPAHLGPVSTSVAYRPADGPAAGGDFYDIFALEDGRLAVILGDVSGHGRQALPHTALVRFTLRAYLEAGLSPRIAMQTAGSVLERQLGESFATVVAATYDPRERILVYACAGHPPPLVIGSKSIAPVTVCSSPPVGAGMPTGARQSTISVPGEALVCFYTDGVTEARVGAELFGVQRLQHALTQLGPQASAAALLASVGEATDARPDDMAACLLGVSGGDAAPVVLLEELELDREELAGERTERFLLACGVQRGEIAELLRHACADVAPSGPATLELRLAEGRPSITLRRANVARLHAPLVRRRATAGVAQ
jgi:serine phosphatase RsbU (regulator of sigma subunit)